MPGDTLWDLSTTYFGNPWEWPRIAGANRGINPNRIEPGNEIRIPGEPEAAGAEDTGKEDTLTAATDPEAPSEEPSSEDENEERLAENDGSPQEDEDPDRRETTAQQREALRILADFVSLTS